MRRQQKRRFNGRSDPVRVDDHEICESGEVAAFVSPGMEESMTLKRPLYPIFEAPEDTADEEGIEDTQHVEKKRRLSVEQVKSLEKHFEKENKLEPERKLQLARELGLQPRQVAVWFQNRRARWKTKQLEKDYDVLKANLDALKGDYSSLLQEKEKLESEVNRLNELLSSRSGEGKPGKPELKVKVEKEDGTMLGMKKDSTSSDSDDSEIVDGESPHPIDSQSGFSYHQDLEMDALECQITGDTYEHLVYPKLSKFEESDSSSFLDLEEDQDGSLSWWDWS